MSIERVHKNPAYGIYISQLVRYAKICSDKREFKARNKRLSTMLEKQGFKKMILEKTFVKFYRNHYDEVRKYGASVKELREHTNKKQQLSSRVKKQNQNQLKRASLNKNTYKDNI